MRQDEATETGDESAFESGTERAGSTCGAGIDSQSSCRSLLDEVRNEDMGEDRVTITVIVEDRVVSSPRQKNCCCCLICLISVMMMCSDGY